MRGSTMRESVTDVRIILECLQEAYQMEGDMVRSGKNIHATMIYPFVRMLQEKCRDLTEEQNMRFQGQTGCLWRGLQRF